MKKTIFIIAALFSGLTINNAGAQERASFGLKLNTNLTNVKLTDHASSGSKFHAGASVGGFSKIYLSPVLSLQPEVIVGYTEAKTNFRNESLKFKYISAEIPVYLQANIKAGTGNVVLGLGPHIGYGLSADTRIEQLPQGDPGENKIELDHWYAGGGATAGYEFANRISVNAGYQLGFDFSSRHKNSGVRTQTISLGAAYRF